MSKIFVADKLKIQGTKTLSTIALILILTVSAIMASMPITNGHSPSWNIPTYAYLNIIPSTQQVNNWCEVVMWTNCVPPTAGGAYGDRWYNFRINVTAPDGTKTQLGPFTSDQLGSMFTIFTPTQVGNYSMVFYWPGQILTNGTGVPFPSGVPYVGDYFGPSASDVVTLQVLQGPIPTWQSAPLPTGYWQLPINALNREWGAALASNWLGGGWLQYNFQNEGQAPNSPHILWQTKIPGTPGGLLDAQWSSTNTNTQVYESPWGGGGTGLGTAHIIMNGILYVPTPPVATTPRYGYYAYDLFTGKQLWYNNGSSIPNGGGMYLSDIGGGGSFGTALTETYPSLSVGQIYHYYAANGAGLPSYLWSQVGSTWYMLDAQTGNWILTLKNVPGGTAVTDQDGSLLLYSYNSATGNVLCWNSSQSIPPPGPTGTDQQQWKPRIGTTIDAQNDTSWTTYPLPASGAWTAADVPPRSGYTMNVTIPKGLPGSISKVVQDDNRVPQEIFGLNVPTVQAGVGGLIATSTATGGNGDFQAWCVKINYNVVPYSPYPNEPNSQNNNLGYTATLLWNLSYAPPAPGNLTLTLGPVSYDQKVFTVYAKETRQWFGYSLADGSRLWGPTASEAANNMYTAGSAMSSVAYGNLYHAGFGGVLYCYDMTTGKLKWAYTATGINQESPYGNYPLSLGAIADGKVYMFSHLGYVQQPLWRGCALRCVDAYTGKELWKIYHWGLGLSVADGLLVSADQYNNMIDCFGKGPSATTVSAPDTAIPLGTLVLIKGTITDQSPGQTSLGIPAAGTPAISDASMEQWMEYLYEQQPMPTNATGVTVTLDSIDPNNNFVHIGNATSDLSGLYSYMWTPPIPGKYTVIATFEGSNSYYASYAETAIGVSNAPTAQASVATPAPTATPPPTVTTTPSPSPLVTTTPVPPPSSAGVPTTYIIIAVVAIIIVVAAAALALRRRK